MKKIFALIIVSLLGMPVISNANDTKVHSDCTMSIDKKTSGVVFRSNQRVKSRDGRRFYFFTNGVCKLYEGQTLLATIKYQVAGDEIVIICDQCEPYKEYRASFTYKSNRIDISSMKLEGTIYYPF